MNQIYPYNYPLILTDDIFVAHGGVTGSSTATQRQTAYVIAEEFVTDDIGTFLLPTIVTGTYYFRQSPLITDYGYVNRVILVRFLDTEEDIYYSISGTANVYASLRNDTYGIIDIFNLFGNCNCASSAQPYPYQVQIVYEAGLPTGTANNLRYLQGLSTAADLVLNQIEGRWAKVRIKEGGRRRIRAW